jgi:hypothetical protein
MGAPSQHYSYTATIAHAGAACGGTSYITLGVEAVTISDGPQDYAGNADCRWVVTAAGPISLYIRSFETEGNFDTVTFYPGEGGSQPPLYTLSGVLGPTLLATNATTLTIDFAADPGVQFAGFVIELSTVQPGGTWAPSRVPVPYAAPTWVPASGARLALASVGMRATAAMSGRVDSITFTCEVGTSELCRADGTLEWSCEERCPLGATSCHIDLGATGLTGTIPSRIGDLTCASLLTYVYAARPVSANTDHRHGRVP